MELYYSVKSHSNWRQLLVQEGGEGKDGGNNQDKEPSDDISGEHSHNNKITKVHSLKLTFVCSVCYVCVPFL